MDYTLKGKDKGIMGKLIMGLFVALVGAAIVAASGLFGGSDGNAISNTANCAYAVEANGGTILDVVRACNPVGK